MSACWRSSRARAGFAAALVIAAAACAVATVDARILDGSRLRDESGRPIKHLHISRHGVTVDADVDTTAHGFVLADSFSHGRIGVDEGDGMVRLFSDAVVGPGEHVDGDVVAVFGGVRVRGSVSGSAVSVFGSVDVAPGASVEGDAVAVGGGVNDAPGSHVGGQTVSVGFLPVTLGLPGLPLMFGFIGLGWLVTVFFGWVFAALFPERLMRVAATSSRRTMASLFVGLLSGPLVPVVAVLLMVTVLGLPIGLLLPFLYVAAVYAGQIAGLDVLGRKLLRMPLDARAGAGPVMAGSTLVASFFLLGSVLWGSPGPVRTVAVFFHLVGVLMLCGLSCIGTGAFLISRAGSRAPGGGSAPPAAPPAPQPIAGVHETA